MPHYRELEMELPASLLQMAGERVAGEMTGLVAGVVAEMRVEDVPLASWAVDAVKELKAGDEDPMEVVVRIPEGRSKRGWHYTRRVLDRIAQEINTTGLPGFLGHQRPEDVDHQFPTPVTHWVGAVVRDEGGKAALYTRGVVDKAAADLKRWIRGKVTRQTSIFGVAQLSKVSGETQVVDFRPLSIDWTPLNRAGMPTEVVAVGEMDAILETGGGVKMDLKELFAALKEQLEKKNTTALAVASEMGWTFEDIAREIGGQAFENLQAKAQVVGEIAQLFGLSSDAKTDDVMAAVRVAAEIAKETARAKREQLINKVIGEMVVAEAARPLVKLMLNVPEDADEAKIRELVAEMLEQDDIKQVFAGLFRETMIRPQNGSKNEGEAGAGVSVRRVRI